MFLFRDTVSMVGTGFDFAGIRLRLLTPAAAGVDDGDRVALRAVRTCCMYDVRAPPLLPSFSTGSSFQLLLFMAGSCTAHVPMCIMLVACRSFPLTSSLSLPFLLRLAGLTPLVLSIVVVVGFQVAPVSRRRVTT